MDYISMKSMKILIYEVEKLVQIYFQKIKILREKMLKKESLEKLNKQVIWEFNGVII